MYVLQSNGYISEDILIWFEEILHLIGRCLVCCRDCLCNGTCFFLPEVLYLVRYEMGLWIKNAYLHVGKKLIDRNEEIYFQEKWLSAKECYLLKRNTLFKECYTFWMKVSVCKACSCHLELVLQEKDACLIVSCSHLQCFRCLFQVRGLDPKLKWSFSCGLNHYLRETLQRGWGTLRYVNYT